MVHLKDNENGAVDFASKALSKQTEPYAIVEDDRTLSEDVLLVTEKETNLKNSFWKNVIVISVGFMLLFIGYYPVSAVQSSLNNEKGLGMAALSAKYSSMAFGNLFTNNFVVDRIGCKWSMSFGMLLYSSYIAANFYPVLETLLPFSILSGIGGAAMWMAQGTYMTRICNAYVALNRGMSEEEKAVELTRVKARVFALFNFLYFGSNALGNLASSLILPLSSNNNMTSERLKHCGAVYCNENLNSFDDDTSNVTSWNLTDLITSPKLHSSVIPDKAHVYYLCTFCITSALIGVLLVVMVVDRLPSLGVNEKVTNSDSVFKLVLATVSHWRHPYQLLLIPLGLYNGMDNTFWSAEFTKAFVTCAVGIHYVGFTMFCYGISSPVFIFIFSFFNRTKFRFVPFLIGLVVQVSVIVTLLQWMPTQNDVPVLFGLSAVWGIGSGVWYPSTYAFISIVFRENMEAAFSNFHLWNNLGSAISYAWSYGFCVHTKLYLLLGIVTVGVVCHVIVEVHLLVTKKEKGRAQSNIDIGLNKSKRQAVSTVYDKRINGEVTRYGSMQTGDL